MHAHDRTLLARLGFEDPDRREALHDLACRYLATEAVARRVPLLLVSPADAIAALTANRNIGRGCDWTEVRMGEIETALESPISRGEGKYKSTVGFLDYVLAFRLEARYRSPTGQGEDFRIQPSAPDDQSLIRTRFDEYPASALIYGEVKTTEIAVGDLLRQLNLYREYARGWCSWWFVAVTFPVSQDYEATLRREGIRLLTLGDKFRRWVMEQETCPPAHLPEL